MTERERRVRAWASRMKLFIFACWPNSTLTQGLLWRISTLIQRARTSSEPACNPHEEDVFGR